MIDAASYADCPGIIGMAGSPLIVIATGCLAGGAAESSSPPQAASRVATAASTHGRQTRESNALYGIAASCAKEASFDWIPGRRLRRELGHGDSTSARRWSAGGEEGCSRTLEEDG